MNNTLLTLVEAAAHTNCSTKTLRRAIRAKLLPRRLVGNEYRLSQEDLDRWTGIVVAPIRLESSDTRTPSAPNASKEDDTPSSSKLADRVFPYCTLGQIRSLMTEELSATLRPMTLYTYNQQWDAVARYIPPETQLLTIDRIQLQQVVTKLAAEGLKPATIKGSMRTLGRLLIRAVEDGVIRRNPLDQVTLPRVVRRPPIYLTGVQVADLMRTAQADSAAATLFFSLGIYLGLRKNEIVNLRWEHLDLVSGVAQVINTETFTTKSGRNRTVPICEDLADLLRTHKRDVGYVVNNRIRGYQGKRYRFNPGRLFERVRQKAGLDTTITPHVLRHTFASLAAQAGVSLYKIGSWMGHTMSEVTEIYAHLAPYDADIERLKFSVR